ncbi:FeoB small GTPase domain-containing protein [Clostridium frigoris]|uniref:FeoB small GTPase domain-containing protein n=1 Tax=Clostridium frigoris TaxID=205327 RepID=UPI0031B84E2C
MAYNSLGKLKFEGRELTVVDLPGTYSLGAYSEDEVVARNFVLKEKPDVVINVIDSTNLERNLYLTMQLIETGAKVILALNMTDEAKKKI